MKSSKKLLFARVQKRSDTVAAQSQTSQNMLTFVPSHCDEDFFQHSCCYRHRKAVSGLFARLAVTADDFIAVRESLQPQHFARGESSFAIDQQIVVRGAGPKGA